MKALHGFLVILSRPFIRKEWAMISKSAKQIAGKQNTGNRIIGCNGTGKVQVGRGDKQQLPAIAESYFPVVFIDKMEIGIDTIEFDKMGGLDLRQ